MARRSGKRPYREPHPELDLDRARGGRSVEVGPDGRWTVQRVAGSERSYTCPGCHATIPPGVAHVVAIAQDHLFGADAAVADRRHWHSACWRSRSR